LSLKNYWHQFVHVAITVMAGMRNQVFNLRDRARRLSALVKLFTLTVTLGFLFARLPASAGNRLVGWGAGTTYNPADTNDFNQSVAPAILTNAVQIAGGWQHSLALRSDGTLLAWGNGLSGQTNLPGGSNYIAVACGRLHSLALQSSGLVIASSGDSTQGQTDVPAGLSNVVAIAGGFYHSLALKGNGTVVAWGAGEIYDPADTTDWGQSIVPAGLSNVVAIAAGGFHSLVLKADGTLTAWGAGTVYVPSDGHDYGQCIIPTGVTNVVAIGAGGGDSVALEANGTVIAWGDNAYGQTNVPAGLSNVVAVAAGGDHNLALKSDGTVVAWGAGIGNNSYVDFKQSTVPQGLSNVVQIAAGLVNSLALVATAPPVTQILITNVVRTTSGFSLVLPTRSGRVYQLQYKNSLTDSVWHPLPLVAGTGRALPLTDTNVADARFYRVNRW
jgi:alpha-tubulin suppressor-like RCC1 family protein